jgi:Lsr2
MRKTITVDDLTGFQSTETAEVSILFDDQAYTLDLAPKSVAAQTALFSERDAGPLRELLQASVIKPVTPKPAATSKPRRRGSEAAEARAWAKANGIPVKDRGKLDAGILARYRETL